MVDKRTKDVIKEFDEALKEWLDTYRQTRDPGPFDAALDILETDISDEKNGILKEVAESDKKRAKRYMKEKIKTNRKNLEKDVKDGWAKV